MNEKKGNARQSRSRDFAKQSRKAQPVRSSQMSADERIVYRANERKRKNRRKKLIARTVIGGVFLLTAIIIGLLMFFNINTVNVSGDEVYSAADIIQESGVETGDNLIFVSEKKINRTLTENLPYIGSVKIKRHLPATLEIVITKTTAEYAVMTEGAYALLDGTGKVLEKGLDFVGDNVIVTELGKIKSAETGKTVILKEEKTFNKLMDLKAALDECGLKGITSADITNIYDIRLVYQGRITLILGETDKDTLTRKLYFGKETIKDMDSENDNYRGTINLTVNGKAYWSEETVTEAPVPEESEAVTDENGSAVSEENTEKNTEENTSSAA